MTTFEWHITEALPYNLSSGVGGSEGLYSVTVEDFDIAIGNIPFLLYAGEDQPYERVTAPWRKEQFDAERNVGEQSLTGWWLRSQNDFSGGSGTEFFEPLLGEGSETRFRFSRGVEVMDEPGEVSLLHETVNEVTMTDADVEALAGPTRVLLRDGGSVSVWDGTTDSAVTGTSTANGLAYTGSLFLVGDDTGILTLDEDTGIALTALWTNATAPLKPFWAKQRIFATSGQDIYELTLAGGDVSLETPIYTHPDPGWEWVSITETGGAVWAAGRSGGRSAVHVITIEADGSTPTLVGGVVGIQLPLGETVNALLGYLDFLLVGTNRGFRVAITQDAQASLGPLVWRDEEVLSLAARLDFVYCGLADGMTRKVDLGNEIAGDFLFAWANHLEGTGDVRSLAFFEERISLACANNGFFVESVDTLVETGTLTTGFTRFGTLENKHFHDAYVGVDTASGSVAVAAGVTDPPRPLVTLANLVGARNVLLHIAGGPAQQVSMMFTLARDTGDPTAGPILQSYQIRALPSPSNLQRLIRFPLMCLDVEKNRWGNELGNDGFAFARLNRLEKAENTGALMLLQDFRIGETRTVKVDQISFTSPESPDQSEKNFGGTLLVTLRAID